MFPTKKLNRISKHDLVKCSIKLWFVGDVNVIIAFVAKQQPLQWLEVESHNYTPNTYQTDT